MLVAYLKLASRELEHDKIGSLPTKSYTYSDFLDLEVPREKPQNPKNYPKLASDSSGTLKIGFSVKFYIYI